MAYGTVTLAEVDQTLQVPSIRGVTAAIAIETKKGPVSEPFLVTSGTQFLSVFTVNDEVPTGSDLGHYSALNFLKKSNKLWVVRVANTAYYAGATLIHDTGSHTAIASGTNLTDPEGFSFDASRVALIYAKNEGAWGNSISFSLHDTSDIENGRELRVYKDGVQVESHLISMLQGFRDGFGRSTYAEDVAKRSDYISILVNPSPIDGSSDPITAPLPALSPVVANVTTRVSLGEGSDGAAVTDTDYSNAIQKVADPSLYDCTLLLDGGRATVGYQSALITLAESRLLVAILSVPADTTSVTDAVTYKTTTLNSVSSHASMVFPWPIVLDEFNNRQIQVPPDSFIAREISAVSVEKEIWYPVAHESTNQLTDVLDLSVRVSESERQTLHSNQIIPILYRIGRGVIIFGNHTLATKPSALQELHIRLMLNHIQVGIQAVLPSFLFTLNDIVTRRRVFGTLESFMEDIKTRRGVESYRLKCDEENNPAQTPNTLYADLWVTPIYAVTEIRLRTIVTRRGVTVEAVA